MLPRAEYARTLSPREADATATLDRGSIQAYWDSTSVALKFQATWKICFPPCLGPPTRATHGGPDNGRGAEEGLLQLVAYRVQVHSGDRLTMGGLSASPSWEACQQAWLSGEREGRREGKDVGLFDSSVQRRLLGVRRTDQDASRQSGMTAR